MQGGSGLILALTDYKNLIKPKPPRHDYYVIGIYQHQGRARLPSVRGDSYYINYYME